MTHEGEIIRLCMLKTRALKNALAHRLTGIGTSVTMDNGR